MDEDVKKRIDRQQDLIIDQCMELATEGERLQYIWKFMEQLSESYQIPMAGLIILANLIDQEARREFHARTRVFFSATPPSGEHVQLN